MKESLEDYLDKVFQEYDDMLESDVRRNMACVIVLDSTSEDGLAYLSPSKEEQEKDFLAGIESLRAEYASRGENLGPVDIVTVDLASPFSLLKLCVYDFLVFYRYTTFTIHRQFFSLMKFMVENNIGFGLIHRELGSDDVSIDTKPLIGISQTLENCYEMYSETRRRSTLKELRGFNDRVLPEWVDRDNCVGYVFYAKANKMPYKLSSCLNIVNQTLWMKDNGINDIRMFDISELSKNPKKKSIFSVLTIAKDAVFMYPDALFINELMVEAGILLFANDREINYGCEMKKAPDTKDEYKKYLADTAMGFLPTLRKIIPRWNRLAKEAAKKDEIDPANKS